MIVDCAYILIPHLIIFPREGKELSTSHSFKEVFFTKCWIKNEAKQQCPKMGVWCEKPDSCVDFVTQCIFQVSIFCCVQLALIL